VVLFDEIEKAHPEVFNVLLQILDDGRLTDAQGRTVDFRNVVVLMTSNIGSQDILESTAGGDWEGVERQVRAQLHAHFRPEFLNRIDDVVVFRPLGQAELRRIVDLQLERVVRLAADAGIVLEVGEDAILPHVQGMKGPLSCLTQARSGIAFGVIGAAMACYECALSYAKDRVQFSRPIAGYQLVQQKLVYMVTEITKAQLLALRLMRLKERKKMTPVQVSLAKRNNCEHALQIARIARDILGGNGIMYEYPISRHMLNLETVYTYEGTHDIHTLIIGHHITGLPAFD
jgi:hypothetical protein